jgi:WD40 repeat protein
VAFSPSGLLLVTGHDSGLLSVRRPDTGALLALQEFPDSIRSLAFSPALKSDQPTAWMAVGDRGGSIHLLPVDNNAGYSGVVASAAAALRGRRWQAHSGRVYAMTFTADGLQLLTAGEDGLLKAWDLGFAQNSWELPTKVNDFAVIGANHIVVTGPTFSVHSLLADRSSRELPGLGKFPARRVRYAPASGQIVMGDERGRIIAIPRDAQDETAVQKLGNSRQYLDFAVTADGRQMAVEWEKDGKTELQWPVSEDSRRSSIPCQSTIHQITFSADDRLLLFTQGNEVFVLDPKTGEQLRRLSGHRSTIGDLASSPDGRFLATASKDRTVRVWDLQTGQEVWSEVAHTNETLCVAFSPDGDTVATTGADGMLRLWRWRKNTLVLEYPLVDWPARKLAYSADGLKLVVLSGERLRIYDATALDSLE